MRAIIHKLACILSALTKVISLMLVLATVAFAQDGTVYAPSMPVRNLGGGVWQCAKEVQTATVTLKSGRLLTFADFTIPPTLVRRHGLKRFVDPCRSFGWSGDMDQFSLDLPAERVILGTAQPMVATGWITEYTGQEHRVVVCYGVSKAVPVGLGLRLRIAQAVTAPIYVLD